MHRSGTSLISRWLHSCGLHLGDRLVGAAIGNPQGHYEDRDFLRWHEEVFRRNRIPYGGLTKISKLDIQQDQITKLKKLIAEKNLSHKAWGWKDPRTCLFIDTYEKLIDDPTFLVVYREAEDVLKSLLKRQAEEFAAKSFIQRLRSWVPKSTLEKNYTASWIYYNENILRMISQTEKHRYRVIHYKDLLLGSVDLISWLNKRGFDLRDSAFSDIFSAEMMGNSTMKILIRKEFRDHVLDIEDQLKLLKCIR